MISDKYKIRIDSHLKNKLISDMRKFNFYKPNDTLNQNKFYSMVLKGMINYYSHDLKITFNSLIEKFPKENKNMLKDLSTRINMKILDFHYNSGHSDLDDSIYIQTTKENTSILSFIENNLLKEENFSEFIRTILFNYTTLPLSIREMIARIDSYSNILKAIDDEKEMYIIDIYGYKYLFRGYNLYISSDETYNYIIGDIIYSDDTELTLLKLSEIERVEITETYYSFTKERIKYFNQQINHNFNHLDDICIFTKIKLDEDGIELYFDNINIAPKYSDFDIETGIATFNSGIETMFDFLKIFGKHVKVIEPQSLKEMLNEFHRSAIDE